MKRLKTGVVNTLSFVKLSSFTVNSFDVTLDKVVGTGSLTITNLTDLNNLDPCKDFIQINIDLLSNDLEGGEYELTITNSGDSYKYLTEVQDYTVTQTGTGIYGSTVRFTDLPVTTPSPSFTGLLDTYSGAAAAYSLRQLSSTYSGNAIKVRRSSDNAEQDIAFVNNQLDTASLETFAGSGDAFVTTWYDQSGNGIDATQTTASAQPKIVSSGSTILENGKPAVKYDGVNDQMLMSSAVDLDNEFFVPLVYKSNRTGSEDYVLYGNSGASRIRLYSGLYRLYIDNATYGFSTANDNFGTQYLFTNEANASSDLIAYRNGTALGASQSIPSGDNWIIRYIGYGATRPINGLMQEVILWDSDQATNRTGIETNINDFYSIY
jgi:hypothetical protein